jgi:hypothetical protein
MLVTPLVTLSAGPGAHAAAACHGVPATIEASSGAVTGTPGPDVIVVTGTVTSVLAGDGNDVVCLVDTRKLGGPQKWLTVDAGGGDDVVDASEAGAKTSTYLPAGADSFTGGSYNDMVAAGFEPTWVRPTGDPGPFRVRTGAGADSVAVGTGAVVDARLGAGDDGMVFPADTGGALTYAGPGSRFDLGSGRDAARFDDWWENPGAYDNRLVADLARGELTWRGVTTTMTGVEDVWGAAAAIVMRGTHGPNRLTGYGCHVTLRGRAGDDTLAMPDGSPETAPSDCSSSGVGHRAYGQAGADYLIGQRGNDVLVGGPGYDMADGKRGEDRCDVEKSWGAGCR